MMKPSEPVQSCIKPNRLKYVVVVSDKLIKFDFILFLFIYLFIYLFLVSMKLYDINIH